LSDETVEVFVGRLRDVQVSLADIVNSLIINHKLPNVSPARHQKEGSGYRAVGVLKGSVSRQDRIVRLNNRRSDLRRGIHSKLQLGFFGVVNGQTLEQKRTESRSSATAKRMEDENALETIAYA